MLILYRLSSTIPDEHIPDGAIRSMETSVREDESSVRCEYREWLIGLVLGQHGEDCVSHSIQKHDCGVVRTRQSAGSVSRKRCRRCRVISACPPNYQIGRISPP
jgi:hypothetical protein